MNVSEFPRRSTVRKVLCEADTLPWNGWLFFPKSEWDLDTQCVIVEDESVFDDTDLHTSIIESGFSAEISIGQVQDVVGNAKQQVTNPSSTQLLSALKYYWDFDAFVTLE